MTRNRTSKLPFSIERTFSARRMCSQFSFLFTYCSCSLTEPQKQKMKTIFGSARCINRQNHLNTREAISARPCTAIFRIKSLVLMKICCSFNQPWRVYSALLTGNEHKAGKRSQIRIPPTFNSSINNKDSKSLTANQKHCIAHILTAQVPMHSLLLLSFTIITSTWYVTKNSGKA